MPAHAAKEPPCGGTTNGGTTNAGTANGGTTSAAPTPHSAIQADSDTSRRIIQAATRPAVPRPVAPDDLIQQTHGTPGCRLGWPLPGAMLRGRARLTVDWMPPEAANLEAIEMQFTGDNARSWDTVASNLPPLRSFKWTVPPLNSKNCRIRLIGTNPAGQRVQVAMSQRFTVQTPEEAIILDVKPIDGDEGNRD